MLAKIGNNDFTASINETSYAVDAVPEYESWTDGYKRVHHDLVRTRVSGSFVLWFYGDDYNDFLDAVNANSSGDVITIRLYIVNENRMRTIDAHYTLTTKKHASIGEGLTMLQMKLEEV